MKTVLLFFVALATIRCSDGPGYQQTNGTPPKIVTKPGECKVSFDKTCWKETIAKVTACLAPDKGADHFSGSHQLCGNDSGKLILFNDPTAIFSHPFDALHTPFNFKVVPDRVNECFEVNGTLANLELKIIKTGETAKFAMDNEKMSFTCLDGQQVVIPRKSVDNCSQTLGNKNEIPGVDAGPFYDGGLEKGWFFRFKGMGESQAEVFRCLH